ncbi:MAG TPA: cysteine synthase A [Candidatus Ornithoclostridium faecavium]|nr:cysteine synthase A [Candidatus Ornithoclostridium faecavium]
MKIYESAAELVGRTPLVRLNNIAKKYGLKAEICAKVESFNPYSVKDRVAVEIIAQAEKDGKLKKGGTIIEPTSGNTGIGLAFIGALKGYEVILVMPESMSVERRKLVAALGAKVVLTPAKEGMQGALDKAEELAKEKGGYIANQFANPANPKAHELTTAKEIIADTDGKVDIFVASVGTGGTLSGTGRVLKQNNAAVKVVAVEPAASPLLTKGYAAPHTIQGIGANFVPDALDRSVIDEIIDVTDERAKEVARELAKAEGLLCGISSGAALAAAIEVAERDENTGKRIVVILPDGGERYMSTGLFD